MQETESTDQEQLVFPFYTDGGLPSLRLLESVESLRLTPFTLKAVRATGTKTVGELAAVINEENCGGKKLGQGHIEEIAQKIESFVGLPPYPKDHRIDWASLLRLTLQHCDRKEVAIVISALTLDSLFLLSPQEIKEAETTRIKDGERRIRTAFERVREKAATESSLLLHLVFTHLVEPWIQQKERFFHESELRLFLFEKGTVSSYLLFEKIVSLFQFLLGHSMIFHRWVYEVTPKMWALTEEDGLWAKAVIADATSLLQKKPTDIRSLAHAVSTCRIFQWDSCSRSRLERLLFWAFIPAPVGT